MIFVTRIKGRPIALNPELIVSVERTPDTAIRFANGETVLVLESLDDVVLRILAYRRALLARDVSDPIVEAISDGSASCEPRAEEA